MSRVVIHNYLPVRDNEYRPGQVLKTIQVKAIPGKPGDYDFRMEVRFEPSTGSSRPFEFWTINPNGGARRVGNFKTAEAALKAIRASEELNARMLRMAASGELKYDKLGRAVDAVSASTKEALAKARSIDPLKYCVGIKCIRLVPDTDNWNAAYVFAEDRIELQGKFEKKPFDDKVQTLLHEMGHRGQVKDADTFRAFQDQGLGSEKNFLAMCNKTHRDDFKKNGIENPDEEAFAESYARFALGLPMPAAIKAFWEKRARQ